MFNVLYLYRFANFPQEPVLWNEVHGFSEALQVDSSVEQTYFLRGMWGILCFKYPSGDMTQKCEKAITSKEIIVSRLHPHALHIDQ